MTSSAGALLFWNVSDPARRARANLLTIVAGTAVYLLLWPDDGIMRKDDIRGVYDGSIFYRKEEEWRTKQKLKKQGTLKKQ